MEEYTRDNKEQFFQRHSYVFGIYPGTIDNGTVDDMFFALANKRLCDSGNMQRDIHCCKRSLLSYHNRDDEGKRRRVLETY